MVKYHQQLAKYWSGFTAPDFFCNQPLWQGRIIIYWWFHWKFDLKINLCRFLKVVVGKLKYVGCWNLVLGFPIWLLSAEIPSTPLSPNHLIGLPRNCHANLVQSGIWYPEAGTGQLHQVCVSSGEKYCSSKLPGWGGGCLRLRGLETYGQQSSSCLRRPPLAFALTLIPK